MKGQLPSYQPKKRRRRPRAGGAKVIRGRGNRNLLNESMPTPRKRLPHNARREVAPPVRVQRPASSASYSPASSPTPRRRTESPEYRRNSVRPTPSSRRDQTRRPAPRQRLSTKRPQIRRRKKWRWVLAPIIAILVAAVAWPLYLLHYGNSQMDHVDALSDRPEGSGSTYLIVGSDKRQAGAINDETIGERPDTTMLLHVPDSGKPALVSLPRDSFVEVPGHGKNKLNAAFSFGGPKLLVQTVEELSQMKVDHYVSVSMGGVRDLVDAVGGINACLDYDVTDHNSGLYWQAGCHDIDGTTALAFSRMRYSDPLGDIGRTARQRQVVSKILEKAASKDTLFSPSTQKALVGAGARSLVTENGAGTMDLVHAAMGIRDVMKDGGLMGVIPIKSLNHRVGRQSTVALDEEKIGPFFEKMRQGTLTPADFFQLPSVR